MNKKITRKRDHLNFLALEDFVNLEDSANDLEKFHRKHPDFAPFALVTGDGVAMEWVSPMEPRFLPAVLAWRDLLRKVWRGIADAWDLETLLGLNPDGYGPWGGTAPWVGLWNHGLDAIHNAGLRIPKTLPRIRARWDAGSFDFRGTEFENSIYALWQRRWRAKVCPMCESYFIATQKADKYCSRFCAKEARKASNRRWWKASGPDWRKRFLADKAKAEKRREES